MEIEIKKQGFRLDRKRKFKDYYYLQGESSNYNFQKIVKLTQNTYESFYKEIISERVFNFEESSISTHYLTGSKNINNKHDYDIFMNHLGYSDKIILNWSYLIHIKQDDILSICENLDSEKIFILSQNPLTEKQQKDFSVSLIDKDYCVIVNEYINSKKK